MYLRPRYWYSYLMHSKKGPPPPASLGPVLEALYIRRIVVDQLIRSLKRYQRLENDNHPFVHSWQKKIAS
jgi:hypothetical protein